MSVSVIHRTVERSGETSDACRCFAAAAAARARSDASESACARARSGSSRSWSRARVPALPRSERASTRAIARLKSHGDGFSICRTHLATTCCLRTAFTDTERLTVVDRGLGKRRSVHVLESLAKPETSSAPRVSVVSARPRRVRDARMKLLVSPRRWSPLARTGKRGAAGGDLARDHLGGGGDGEVGGDDGGHFCCCVVCVKRGVCANMTRGPRSPMALLGGGSFYLRLSDWPMWILSASSGSGVAKKRKDRSQNRRSRRETLFVPRACLALNELCSCLFVLQTRRDVGTEPGVAWRTRGMSRPPLSLIHI